MASRATRKKTKKPGRSVQHVSPVEGADVELHLSRKKFLAILDKECPEVGEELRDSVWPEYKNMFQELEKARKSGEASESETAPRPADGSWGELYESQAFNVWFTGAKGDPAVKGFARTLDDWVAKYHLEADWFRDTAIRTIRAWEQVPGLADQSFWVVHQIGYRHSLRIEEQQFTFSCPSAWDPTHTTRERAKQQITKVFNDKLKTWLDERERLAEERGYREAPVRPTEEQQYRWWVRRRLLDEGPTAIARRYNLPDPQGSGRKRVEKGIKAAAKRLGLEN